MHRRQAHVTAGQPGKQCNPLHLWRVDDRKLPLHVLQVALEAAAVAVGGRLPSGWMSGGRWCRQLKQVRATSGTVVRQCQLKRVRCMGAAASLRICAVCRPWAMAHGAWPGGRLPCITLCSTSEADSAAASLAVNAPLHGLTFSLFGNPPGQCAGRRAAPPEPRGGAAAAGCRSCAPPAAPAG